MMRAMKSAGRVLLTDYNVFEQEGSGEGFVENLGYFGEQVTAVWNTLAGNKDLMYLFIVGLITIVAIPMIIMGAYRRKRRREGPAPMTQPKYGLYEWACVVIMVLLVSSDMFAMINMFTFFGLTPAEFRIYSATFALFLEGFPWVLGRITPLIKDPVQYVQGRRRAYRRIAFMCWLGLFAAWALTIVIRFLYTYEINPNVNVMNLTVGDIMSSGFNAFLSGRYNNSFGYDTGANDGYLAQVFLFVSPILTSVLAYALTLVAFSSNNAALAAKDMQKALEYHQWCDNRYQSIHNRCMDAKRSIWASLNGNPGRYIDDPATFRRSCHVLIHDNLIEECLDAYPSMLKQYNEAVESVLADFISQCAEHSSEPHKVARITVEEIIQEYEKGLTEAGNKWRYEECSEKMCADLEELLDHTIIMAQFRKAAK